jgi:hypothetical protein
VSFIFWHTEELNATYYRQKKEEHPVAFRNQSILQNHGIVKTIVFFKTQLGISFLSLFFLRKTILLHKYLPHDQVSKKQIHQQHKKGVCCMCMVPGPGGF